MSSENKISLFTRCNDDDLDSFILMAKSLEMYPPLIDFDLFVLRPEENSERTNTFLNANNIKNIFYTGTYGKSINDIMKYVDSRFMFFFHPDIIFIREKWCDQIISILVHNHLGLIGAKPFQKFQVINREIEVVGDHILFFQKKLLEEISGFDEFLDLVGHNFISQTKMMNRNISAVGADINDVFFHLKRCSFDKAILSQDSQVNEYLMEVYNKEKIEKGEMRGTI